MTVDFSERADSSQRASDLRIIGRYDSLGAFAAGLAVIDTLSLTTNGGVLRVHPVELHGFGEAEFGELVRCCAELGLALTPDAELGPHRVELVALPVVSRAAAPHLDARRAPLRPF